tara:strand:- start:397 stop:576 length:180 start_codon:yes stop_codon:yes gene_type:complete
MNLDDVMSDLFHADKSQRLKILQETMYRIQWENMRKNERQNVREKAMIHRSDARKPKND